MKRIAVIGVAVAAALAAGIGVAVVLLARDDDRGAPPPSELVVVAASLSPTVHAFGDLVLARVDVAVNTREIEVASLLVQPRFEPYDQLGPPRVSRSEAGALGRLRVEYRLVCLREGCDAAGARGVSDLEPGRVRYRFRGSTGNAFKAFDWPLIEVASRVGDDAVSDIRWRVDESALPPISYRVAPAFAAAVLLLVASALAAAAGLIAYRLWWPPRVGEEARRDQDDLGTPLERAFDAALAASDSDFSADRRRALERVARELGLIGHDELADAARTLAWSQRVSTIEEITRLAARAGVGGTDGATA